MEALYSNDKLFYHRLRVFENRMVVLAKATVYDLTALKTLRNGHDEASNVLDQAF